MSSDGARDEIPIDPGGATIQSCHDSGAFTVPAAANGATPPARLTSADADSHSNDDEHLVITRAPGSPSAVSPPAVAPHVVSPPVFDQRTGSVPPPRDTPDHRHPTASTPNIADSADSQSTLRRVLFSYSNWRRSLSLSARKLEMPPICACCSGKPDASFEARYVRTTGVRVLRSTGYVWAFPYCSACLRHVRRAELSRTIYWSAAGSAFALVALAAFTQGWIVGGLIAANVVAAAVWFTARKWQHVRLARMLWADCACFGPAVRYDHFKGTVHRFSFASHRFAAAFQRANEKKIVAAEPP